MGVIRQPTLDLKDSSEGSKSDEELNALFGPNFGDDDDDYDQKSAAKKARFDRYARGQAQKGGVASKQSNRKIVPFYETK